jgi:hypothetical protein
MDIKKKIEEMERISQEIQEELAPVGMSFRWNLDLAGRVVERETFNIQCLFRSFKEEMYENLIRLGVLPSGSGGVDSPKPESR